MEAGGQPATVLTAKGDGVEEGVFKDDEDHLFRETVTNFSIVSACFGYICGEEREKVSGF